MEVMYVLALFSLAISCLRACCLLLECVVMLESTVYVYVCVCVCVSVNGGERELDEINLF